jgi:hypothetical protein
MLKNTLVVPLDCLVQQQQCLSLTWKKFSGDLKRAGQSRSGQDPISSWRDAVEDFETRHMYQPPKEPFRET